MAVVEAAIGWGDRIEREKTPRALSLLYKVIDQRNTRRSTALVTNIEFEIDFAYVRKRVSILDVLALLEFRPVRCVG